jgi:homogentisate 1,2-dioxygenase
MGSLGFSGPASLLYHIHPPTRILTSQLLGNCQLEVDPDPALRMRHFRLHALAAGQSPTLDRVPLLFNADVKLSLAYPKQEDAFFYRNAQADEILYVAEGSGTLESEFGLLPYRAGDYLVVPRGILHRLAFDSHPQRLFIIESTGLVHPPKRYLNETGQFLEHAPYCERDIRPPAELHTVDEQGEFRVLVKQRDLLTEITLDHHPLDVVGWDGQYYPWALSIHDFMPITGALHQPPPVHQTFAADGFVVCSFVPRAFDYHPEALPAPYNHSNVMSDEILYYANDEFMSRSGISFGSLTLHPAGIPHGPHPGRAEASIGKERTEELAVMLDTFRPMLVARRVLEVEDKTYARSWLE